MKFVRTGGSGSGAVMPAAPADLNAFEQPGHIASQCAHHLHAFQVMPHLIGRVAMHHVPVF